ncbi:LLM class flavin-dependent oxidoreductase [Prauserella alba]|uniref:LLM class flavin-dependent oxidoreductase n=1 Tax=Prauserella alba TaxID=176898 RepID=A0ABP4G8D1_9PSEU|nr:LLM class flavin-dependent oxidoreductase [Prauserella alba]MCP2182056.1 Luciferase-like monooxygenase [Prauserella alba]
MRVGIVILPEDRWWAAEPKWRAAEEYGFDHAWTYDHLGWRNLVDGPWFGAVPTLTAAATVTSHIRLGTFVTSPNFRHPLPLMREVITLDDLSDGRFILGVGAGGTGYDATVFGEPELTAGQRADRFIEFTTALDGLLRIDGFDHSGEYYTVEGARNLPGAVQHPRPPLVIAANGPRTIRFAAATGDAWLTTGRNSDELESWWKGVAELSARLDEELVAAERDPATLQRHLSLDAAPVYSLTSKEAFVDAAGRAAALGFTDVVAHWPRSSSPYQGREVVLEEVADDVLPGLQERPAAE